MRSRDQQTAQPPQLKRASKPVAKSELFMQPVIRVVLLILAVAGCYYLSTSTGFSPPAAVIICNTVAIRHPEPQPIYVVQWEL